MRADSLARASTIERPATAYIARFPVRDGVADYELSWAELDRDGAWVAARLADLGLTAGQRALLTFSGFEGPWLLPVISAVRSLGIGYGIAEAMGWDHRRSSVFLRDLKPYAVLGLTEDTVAGLSGQALPRDQFADTPVVLARPLAAAALHGAGVPAGVLAPLGPALAIECAERHGAHVNAAEWTITGRDGDVVITPAGDRAPGLGEQQLGIAATVLTDHCACGNDDPRVLFH